MFYQTQGTLRRGSVRLDNPNPVARLNRPFGNPYQGGHRVGLDQDRDVHTTYQGAGSTVVGGTRSVRLIDHHPHRNGTRLLIQAQAIVTFQVTAPLVSRPRSTDKFVNHIDRGLWQTVLIGLLIGLAVGNRFASLLVPDPVEIIHPQVAFHLHARRVFNRHQGRPLLGKGIFFHQVPDDHSTDRRLDDGSTIVQCCLVELNLSQVPGSFHAIFTLTQLGRLTGQLGLGRAGRQDGPLGTLQVAGQDHLVSLELF